MSLAYISIDGVIPQLHFKENALVDQARMIEDLINCEERNFKISNLLAKEDGRYLILTSLLRQVDLIQELMSKSAEKIHKITAEDVDEIISDESKVSKLNHKQIAMGYGSFDKLSKHFNAVDNLSSPLSPITTVIVASPHKDIDAVLEFANHDGVHPAMTKTPSVACATKKATINSPHHKDAHGSPHAHVQSTEAPCVSSPVHKTKSTAASRLSMALHSEFPSPSTNPQPDSTELLTSVSSPHIKSQKSDEKSVSVPSSTASSASTGACALPSIVSPRRSEDSKTKSPIMKPMLVVRTDSAHSPGGSPVAAATGSSPTARGACTSTVPHHAHHARVVVYDVLDNVDPLTMWGKWHEEKAERLKVISKSKDAGVATAERNARHAALTTPHGHSSHGGFGHGTAPTGAGSPNAQTSH